MRKRLLLVWGVMALLAVSLIYYRFTSSDNFVNIDVHGFYWSGENEGEMVEVRSSSPTQGSPPIPPFNRFSLARGIDEVTNRYKKTPLLPTRLPREMKFADVYIGPDVIICFSDRAVTDFRWANISIEISPSSAASATYSPEQLRKALEETNGTLIQIGDIWVSMIERAHSGFPEVDEAFGPFPLAWFWKDGLYYVMGVTPPLTPQDLTKIIESMKPLS